MQDTSRPAPLKAEEAVRDRYAKAAQAPEQSLCCAVEYDRRYLEAIPKEVIERDYGCGDPSKYLRPGETVLDLGSGTGKICFIAAQVVGREGRVIGIDMTDEMLGVARKAAPAVAKKIGYANVEFRKGRIQDLALDLEALDKRLKAKPITGVAAFLEAESVVAELRKDSPLVADNSVDVVVSNCVLNLVDPAAKRQLFAEILRVLKNGGRAVISDIVSDEVIPEHLRADPTLWSGCISGAFTELGFLQAFEEAGFCGIRVLDYGTKPWQTVEGIEFRSITVEASKGKQGQCFDRNQAVIYKGPFKEVLDDDGHRMERGKRYAMCAKTFGLFSREPYRDHFILVEPATPVPSCGAPAWDYTRSTLRDPRETKGGSVTANAEGRHTTSDGRVPSDCCGPAADSSPKCC